MSFAPNARRGTGIPPAVRTVLFWILMVALAVVLWQKVSGGKGNGLSYSEFLQQVERHNIATATLVISRTTADVNGSLRDPAQEYRAGIPRASASDLTDTLRKQGVNVGVSKSLDWLTALAYGIPSFIALHLINRWLFALMNRVRAGQTMMPDSKAPPNISACPPSNTPL